MKTVYFNNWFSSLGSTIDNIKKEYGDYLNIITSSINENCTYKTFSDKHYLELKYANTEEYMAFIRSICKSNNVDIMFARNRVHTLAKNREYFEDNGISLICEDIDTLNLMDSKAGVYEYLAQHGYKEIPEYYIINSTEEFEKAFRIIDNNGVKVCIKYDHDEGAQSFRIITDSILNEYSLNETLENMITYDNMLAILDRMQTKGKMKTIMVMPKLSSPEVSVDCYYSPAIGFIAIPRYKYGSRVKKIILNEELINNCKQIYDIFKFKYGFNVQYRWDSDKNFKLLEINPRLSGGIHMTDMCGLSIVNQIIADVFDIDIEQSIKNIKEITLTQIEVPVILE